jgi:protein CpsH
VEKSQVAGKKILFFSPAFFGYEYKIAQKMRNLGAEVDYYDVRSVYGAFARALLKVSPALFHKRSLKYYKNIIEQNRLKNYDYIVIIKGDMTPIPILKEMRKVYDRAKFVLYLWDSIENIPNISSKFDYFDRLLTFDLNDAKENTQFIFRPLFYGDDYISHDVSSKAKYDLAFLGTIHSDRYKILKKINQFSKENNLSAFYFAYLQSKFIYYYYKLTRAEYFNVNQYFFSFKKMDSVSIAKVISESNVIIDIEHPKQTGLTMRTIEMIGMQKKLLTTNSSIKNYDFYNKQNIYIIDRNVSKLDIDFFNTPYKPLDRHIYKKYSLEQWVLDVLGEDDE